jgi:hypothetical protein
VAIVVETEVETVVLIADLVRQQLQEPVKNHGAIVT